MRITPRTIRLLRYLSVHRLLTPQITNRRFIANQSTTAAVSWLRRLRELQHVKTIPLFGQRLCSVLTRKGARNLRKHGYQVARNATKPLSSTAKRDFYAINLFCNEQCKSSRHFYRPYLDPVKFPLVAQRSTDPFQHKHFIRDGEVLTLFVVDRGTPKFINECLRPKVFDLLNPTKYPDFTQLLEAGCFRLAVATGSDSRGDELLLELQGNPPPMLAEVIVYPDLAHFMPLTQSAIV